MRKIFVLFLLSVFSFVAHTETGYRGIKWLSTKAQLETKLSLKPAFNDTEIDSNISDLLSSFMSTSITENVILGKKTEIEYVFMPMDNEDVLISIIYITDAYRIKELQDNLKRIRLYKTSFQYMNSTDFFSQIYLDSIGVSKNDITQKLADNTLGIMCASLALDDIRVGENSELFSFFKLEIPNSKNNKATGTLYIYDYNDDTRVYIYDNIIKDKAVVVYVPHEQDY